jgi:hypothetical protein
MGACAVTLARRNAGFGPASPLKPPKDHNGGSGREAVLPLRASSIVEL